MHPTVPRRVWPQASGGQGREGELQRVLATPPFGLSVVSVQGQQASQSWDSVRVPAVFC